MRRDARVDEEVKDDRDEARSEVHQESWQTCQGLQNHMVAPDALGPAIL
jgi:hypothetical protein